jgi:uncharacterized protein (TIGR02231 family)
MMNVSFTPHYTLRAESTGDKSSLQIRYQARISNNTGEDWNEVSLSISTAQASETTVVPQMMRWTVDFQAPVTNIWNKDMKRKAARPMLGGLPQMQAQVLYASAPRGRAFGAPAPSSAMVMEQEADGGGMDLDLVTAAAEVSEGITSTFIIPGKQTIKDGEKNHTVVIRDLTLEGKFANICVPKIKDCAYLQVDSSRFEI